MFGTKPAPVKTVCAWCPYYGRSPMVLQEGIEPASHGICVACADDWEHDRPGGPRAIMVPPMAVGEML